MRRDCSAFQQAVSLIFYGFRPWSDRLVLTLFLSTTLPFFDVWLKGVVLAWMLAKAIHTCRKVIQMRTLNSFASCSKYNSASRYLLASTDDMKVSFFDALYTAFNECIYL
jgi:hypothetical protein